MWIRSLVVFTLLSIAGIGVGGDGVDGDRAVGDRAGGDDPSPSTQDSQRWLTDLESAEMIARETGRPLLIVFT